MLILTRKKGESVLIGKDVMVKILEVEGDRVRIGISAPNEMKVLRAELYEEIMRENKHAVNITIDDLSYLEACNEIKY